jgi:hypothetical protein
MTFDYVFYVDMDAIIMNLEQSLDHFIEAAGPNKDFIMTSDWNGINSGVWLARNSDFTRWFLSTAWNQSHLVPSVSAEGITHPFEYEQRAFHYLLDTPEWQQTGLSRYQPPAGVTIASIRSHFAVLPQCAFNSYSVYFFDFRADREASQYVKGDFLIHLAGKRGVKKKQILDYYLSQAELTY